MDRKNRNWSLLRRERITAADSGFRQLADQDAFFQTLPPEPLRYQTFLITGICPESERCEQCGVFCKNAGNPCPEKPKRGNVGPNDR